MGFLNKEIHLPGAKQRPTKGVQNVIDQVAFATFPFADYDGGFPVHMQPETSGRLVLSKDGSWQIFPNGTNQYFHGGLSAYRLEAEDTGPASCKVTLVKNVDPNERATLLLPKTKASEFSAAISNCLAEQISQHIAKVAFADFPLADYDGGLPAHGQPVASGRLLLTKDGNWQILPEGVVSYFYGGLGTYRLEAEKTGPESCKVTLFKGADPNERATFRLPRTSASELSAAISQCLGATVDQLIAKVASAVFPFADYDGGLPAHGQLEASGRFVLTKDGRWQLHPDGTVTYFYGGLAAYRLEADETGPESCKVSLVKRDDVNERASFTLPSTTTRKLQEAIHSCIGAVTQAQAKAQKPLQQAPSGAWWLKPGVFQGLGFSERFTVTETEYHGGWSGHPQPHGKTNILEVDKHGIGLRGFKTIFTIPWDQISDVVIDGPEAVAKRVTAGRVLALGVFALAAKKKTKSAIVLVTMANGEQAVFESHSKLPHEISPKLSPLIAQVRVRAADMSQPLVPTPSPTPAAPPGGGSGIADELAKLAGLRDAGILTEEEFSAQKMKLLNS
jgi:hypothetical protein